VTQPLEILARLDEKPTLARTIAAARDLDALSADQFEERTVAVVRNFTIEPIEPLLKVAAYRVGLRLDIRYSGYEPASPETFEVTEGADNVILALRLEEMIDELTPSHVDDAVDHVIALATGIRSRASAQLLVHNFASPMTSLVDSQDPAGPLNLVRSANVELARRVSQMDGTYILDLDYLFSQVGHRSTADDRGARVGDAPLSQDALRALAEAEVRHIRALSGPVAKCIVLDCDNTLWGGVIGEDGISGIELGGQHRELQRTLLDLRRRGILLTIASKNEETDVLQVLRTHPECLLSEDDFAAIRVNWDDKATNIESIAEELNLGLGHFVFLDDNPVECDWVRQQLPDLHVVQWPAPIDQLGLFDSLVLTDEDRARTEMYRAERQRRAVREEVGTMEDYLGSLEMVAVVGLVGPERLARIAQLVQKTNQFNLTVRRHDAAAIEAMCADPNTRVAWLELRDRFGSNGIVGCGIVRNDDGEAVIDTLLMSCRVIGREVERVLVNRLAKFAREMGADELVGEYRPADRNGQVADLYPRLGFSGPDQGPWRWSLDSGPPDVPDWFDVVDAEGAAV
jgi:FkbH-like protein